MRLSMLYCMLFLQCLAIGQSPFVFHRFSTADGLNTNKVKCVWQDQKGFIWIGSEVGIQRFDGRKIVSFGGINGHQSPPSLEVDQILDAGNGNLWLLQGSHIGKFNTMDFQYVGIPINTMGAIPERNEFKLFIDGKGQTFLCASRYGLLWFDTTTMSFVDKNLPIKTPKGWGINAIYEDTETGEYFISSNRGLAIYNSATGSLTYEGHNPENNLLLNTDLYPNSINFIHDNQGTWWAGYWDYNKREDRPRMLHYDPSTKAILSDTLGIHSSTKGYSLFRQMLETRKGQIWIAGDNTLISSDNDAKGFTQHLKDDPKEFDIKCATIYHLFEDHEGNLWLSTDNGLYFINLAQREVYNMVIMDDDAQDTQVNALLETHNGEIWIGTWGNGLIYYDADMVKIQANPYAVIGKEDLGFFKKIWDLCQHKTTHQIWAACQNGSLAIFDPESKKVLQWLKPPVFENTTIRQVKEDKNGNLWFGTQNGSLIKWVKNKDDDNGSFELVHKFNTIIYKLYFDDQDHLWIGTHRQGVYVVDVGTNIILNHFDKAFNDRFSILDNSILDIQQYNDSIFFLGSQVLNILNISSGKVSKVSAYEGLNGSMVSQLMLDDEGILWMITNNGLGNYNYDKKIITAYNNLHGIIYGERTNAAKFKMKNGKIWFGGENVVFGFLPETLKYKEPPPSVVLTDFKLFNKYMPLDSIMAQKEVTLKHYQNSFTFYFSALNFNQQHKLQYYYRIPGINRDWVKAEQDLAANYTTVPPGRYTFEVKCMNIQGLESKEVTILGFRVLPPFYGTWWFLTLLSLGVLGLVYLFYRLKLNKMLAVEKLRNKVARDLHDDMGSTLSTINILSSMAKSKMNSDNVTSSNYLTKITDNSQRMMEAMDDIVWSIKPDNDSMQRVLARMREYATSVLEAKDIEVTFQIEDRINHLKLNMEARRDLFLIFKEAINNSAKYSHSNQVFVNFYCKNKRLFMHIKDNGVGFEIHNADNGNGLDNMHKRAEAVKGGLVIQSHPGAGTEITLNIPMSPK